MLKLAQLLAQRSDADRQAEIDRRNDPMRQAFNILAQANRNYHDALPVVTQQNPEQDAENNRDRPAQSR